MKQMQIDKMEKVDRPVLERRKMALALRSAVARRPARARARGRRRGVRPDDPVLLDVELVVARGERVGVVGPNGAGKTALLRTLGGTLEPAGGRALDRRRDRGRLPLAGRRRAAAGRRP